MFFQNMNFSLCLVHNVNKNAEKCIDDYNISMGIITFSEIYIISVLDAVGKTCHSHVISNQSLAVMTFMFDQFTCLYNAGFM